MNLRQNSVHMLQNIILFMGVIYIPTIEEITAKA